MHPVQSCMCNQMTEGLPRRANRLRHSLGVRKSVDGQSERCGHHQLSAESEEVASAAAGLLESLRDGAHAGECSGPIGMAE